MLHDRHPILTVLCDKHQVRDFVAAKGWKSTLIPVLWSGADPELIPFDRLPSKFVIKATHGCAYNIFVRDKAQIEPRKVRLQLTKWLSENYCEDYHLGTEWGYKHIKPSIIIEDFLDDTGKVPIDYKFYCFSGRVELLSMHFGRFFKHTTKTFDRNFEPHEFRYQFDLYPGECRRPTNFDLMVNIAESLTAEFDFMRVDLYNIDGSVFFGELTPYTGGISLRFLPRTQDYALGEKWKHS